MTAINKSTLPSIRAEINAALQAVGAKHGLNFSLGNIRFTDTTFSGKLEAAAVGATGTLGASAKATVEAIDLKMMGPLILGQNVDLTKEYTSPTLGKVQLVGYHPRKPKYPFIVQTKLGKRFKISIASARNLVGA